MSEELANIMGAISTESLIAELMRRHYLEPIRKSEKQIEEERREFLLANYAEAELHAKKEHPDWEYDTFECYRKTDLGWNPEKEGWVYNEDHEGGHYRDDYLDHYYYRRLKSKKADD